MGSWAQIGKGGHNRNNKEKVMEKLTPFELQKYDRKYKKLKKTFNNINKEITKLENQKNEIKNKMNEKLPFDISNNSEQANDYNLLKESLDKEISELVDSKNKLTNKKLPFICLVKFTGELSS